VLEQVSFLVSDAALAGTSRRRRGSYEERLGAGDTNRIPARVEPVFHQVKSSGGGGYVLDLAFPEPERELDAIGADPEREARVVEALAHQLAERAAGALDERPRQRAAGRAASLGAEGSGGEAADRDVEA